MVDLSRQALPFDNVAIKLVPCRGRPYGSCKVLNGTHYDTRTPDQLVYKLEQIRSAGERVRFVLGDDGVEWGDVQVGRIGRSTGTCKIPLVMFNRRSLGGGALSHCVVRIESSKGRHILWESPAQTALDFVLKGYIEAALWSTNDESTPDGGEPLDKKYGRVNIDDETVKKMRADCERFLATNGELIDRFVALTGRDLEHVGHDFWLTRNGHGVGFWDRDAGELGDRLSAACTTFGEVWLYVGDDGRIYQ